MVKIYSSPPSRESPNPNKPPLMSTKASWSDRRAVSRITRRRNEKKYLHRVQSLFPADMGSHDSFQNVRLLLGETCITWSNISSRSRQSSTLLILPVSAGPLAVLFGSRSILSQSKLGRLVYYIIQQRRIKLTFPPACKSSEYNKQRLWFN